MTTNVSFSLRYDSILKITQVLASHGNDAATSRAEAQKLEQQILLDSTSLEEYQAKCDRYIQPYTATLEESITEGEKYNML